MIDFILAGLTIFSPLIFLIIVVLRMNTSKTYKSSCKINIESLDRKQTIEEAYKFKDVLSPYELIFNLPTNQDVNFYSVKKISDGFIIVAKDRKENIIGYIGQ